MSDVEIKRTESLSREEAAGRLSALAAALSEGGHVEVELGASTVKLHVPDHVKCEVEVEVDGDEVELEVELTWSTAPVAQPASAPQRSPLRGRLVAPGPQSVPPGTDLDPVRAGTSGHPARTSRVAGRSLE